MKKEKRNLQGFLLTLFLVVLFSFWALDSVGDFSLGFMSGFSESAGLSSDPRTYYISRLIAVIFVIFVFLIIKKKVSDPIKRLSESMERVQQGDLDEQMDVVDSFEFRQMEKDFNSMVCSLREARNLREQNAEKNRKLYAEIAHDLKTPMTMILGYAKLLSQGEASPDKQKEYLSTIIEQTENANALLEQMLEYAKLGSTEYRLDQKEGDLAECLRQVAAESYYRFEEKKMELDVEIPDDIVTLWFDERQMGRVFLNLIGNVIHHNPEGTSVKIIMKNGEDWKRTEDEAAGGSPKRIEIWVADNGPLIEEGMKDQLFEPFQLGADSHKSQGGSGLGLSVAKKIIQLHGGDLEYREHLMEGYKGFVLTIPDALSVKDDDAE